MTGSQPDATPFTFPGTDGGRHAVRWTPTGEGGRPRFVALLSHGYGEHLGRYEHVVTALVDAGAVVYGLDHAGHGRSEGERAAVRDYDALVADLHALDDRARKEHPDLPVVLVGHSMGGLVAARYAQQYQDDLAALALSGPQLGGREMLEQLLEMPEMPSFPIDPAVLSRDPQVGEAYLADPLVWHGDLKRTTAEAMVAAQRALEDGPRLTVPVLWLQGSEDFLAPADTNREVLARLVAGPFEQHLYDGARHEIFNETNRDEVLGDLVGFLRGVVSANG